MGLWSLQALPLQLHYTRNRTNAASSLPLFSYNLTNTQHSQSGSFWSSASSISKKPQRVLANANLPWNSMICIDLQDKHVQMSLIGEKQSHNQHQVGDNKLDDRLVVVQHILRPATCSVVVSPAEILLENFARGNWIWTWALTEIFRIIGLHVVSVHRHLIYLPKLVWPLPQSRVNHLKTKTRVPPWRQPLLKMTEPFSEIVLWLHEVILGYSRMFVWSDTKCHFAVCVVRGWCQQRKSLRRTWECPTRETQHRSWTEPCRLLFSSQAPDYKDFTSHKISCYCLLITLTHDV